MIPDHVAQLLKTLPNLPGVYQMLGKNGEILYVGKAKSLKLRVNSYFHKTHEHPKTQALVERICDIKTLIVRSETEALLLEQNLIKEHKPPYNVVLRDDKSYLYVVISQDEYPKLTMGRGRGTHHQERFFGPYPSAHNAKHMVDMLQKLFMLRTCSNAVFTNAKRPCLEYQIKRCKAPCVGLIDKQSYADDVLAAIQFLKGQTTELTQDLTAKMMACAENMQFEQALMYRERLQMLAQMASKQAVYRLSGEADVFAIAMQAGIVCVHVMTIRQGKVLGGKNYFPDTIMTGKESLAEHLAQFVGAFYFQVSDELPKELIVNQQLPNMEAVEEVLQRHFGTKTQLKYRVQQHRAEWVQLAQLNAKNALAAQLSDYHELQQRFLALQQVLVHVDSRTVNRIECFDISHTMGELAVGACVVFDRAGARKRDYRQYAIHDITTGDDYAAMRQVLTRRYQKHPMPDMVLIDGGKGQLAIAKEVLQSLGKLDEVLLVAVAKGEGRKAGLEVLHFVSHEPMDLPADHKALHLLLHIRDEAHRFAISTHRKKRDKARSGSILEVIPHLGSNRRRALLAHFGGIQSLLGASINEIAQVKGIGKTLATTIYKALHE